MSYHGVGKIAWEIRAIWRSGVQFYVNKLEKVDSIVPLVHTVVVIYFVYGSTTELPRKGAISLNTVVLFFPRVSESFIINNTSQ